MDLAAFLYSDALARFDYGDNHPFKPMRARNTLELCNRYALLNARGIMRPEPQPADPAVLEWFHDPAYLNVLRRADAGSFDLEMLACGLGTEDCPVVAGMYDFCRLALGATLLGVDLVMTDQCKRAFNLVGGFHHAGRDHAEGFCYINDVGVAIAGLLAQGRRVAFVDIDAHHCNGVQDAFYEDDRVLCISLHESGQTLYPFGGFETEIGEGRGRGFNVNVPLLAKTDDEVYVETFRQIVPPLLLAFQPDLVLAEIGADTLISDPLTHMRLTNNGYHAVVRDLCRLAPRLVAVGGGGYDVFRTARCWTLAWSAMAELEPTDDFAGLVGGMLFGAGTETLFDPPVVTRNPDKAEVRQQAERVVRHIHEHVFPLVGAQRP